jgi:hypothetical protein
VNTFSRSQSLQGRVLSARRSRPITRFPLRCEGLESRQLLSVAPGGFGSGAVPSPFLNTGQGVTPAVVLSLPAGSLATIEIEFGSLAGFTAFQFNFSGGGGFSSFFGSVPAATPTPSTPVFGPALGTLTGITNSGLTIGNASSAGNTANALTTLATNPAITPLNPNATSIASSTGLNPVPVVPPPIQPFQPAVVHLTASASPVTNIAFSTLLSTVQEQPTGLTHFGQELRFPDRSLWTQPVEPVEPTSLIDWVEPAKPAVPAEGEKIDGGQPVDPAPAPNGAHALPGLTDRDVAALFDLGEDGQHRPIGGSQGQPDNEPAGTYYSWSLSTVFGATIVAAGGYQLAIRESDRFKARWTPRWIGSERPTKRKSGSAR